MAENSRLQIFAHRGANTFYPENSLAAFEKAMQLGADGVELDVRMCASGEVVVFHDTDLPRMTKTNGWVKEKTFSELKNLRLYQKDQETQEKIPTLQEVFDLIKDKIMINVEIKTERFRSTGVEIPVIDMIKQNRLADSVVVSSFSPMVLERIHLHAPEIKLGFLYSERSFLNDFWAKKLGKFAWHPEWHLVGEKLVKKAKELNRLVYTWTIDNPDDFQKLAQIQVKGIISNKPENFVNKK